MIEEILPLNYYNEMIGIVVDTTIIKLFVNKFMPNLSPFLEEKKDFLGEFIGNNFISRGLTNLFSNGMIDKDLSLLIWDYLFIEGNKVLLKTFLAFYYYLSDIIIKGEKSLEFYNEIITKEIKKIKINNEDFIFNLFFKDDNYFSKINLNEIRFNLSLQVADTLEEENIEHIKIKVRLNYDTKLYDKQMNKVLTCNEKWPYCISDTYFENVNKTVLYSVFHEINNKYISNYFFSDKKEKQDMEKKEIDDNKLYEIKVERRPHYCSQTQNQIKSFEENNIKNEIENNKKDNEDKKLISEIQSNEENKINRLYQRTASCQSYIDATKIIEQKIDLQINNIENNEL